MTKLFHLDQYTRHDRNARYSSCQVPVTDEQTIARLEAEYRAHQRQQGNPRPPFVAHDGHYSAPTVRSERRPKRRESETRNNG